MMMRSRGCRAATSPISLWRIGRVEHDRNAEPLRRRPEPVGGAVLHPDAIPFVVQRQPHAEHALLIAPGFELARAPPAR